MPMNEIEAEYFQNNERWFGYRFKVPGKDHLYQVYGATPKGAEDRLYEELDKMVGKLNYAVKKIDKGEQNDKSHDPNACYDAPTR